MFDDRRPTILSSLGLVRLGMSPLSGAPLKTLLILLANLDDTGAARISQSQLCDLLGTGPGRVWQSLQKLVEDGYLLPSGKHWRVGHTSAYRVPEWIAVSFHRFLDIRLGPAADVRNV